MELPTGVSREPVWPRLSSDWADAAILRCAFLPPEAIYDYLDDQLGDPTWGRDQPGAGKRHTSARVIDRVEAGEDRDHHRRRGRPVAELSAIRSAEGQIDLGRAAALAQIPLPPLERPKGGIDRDMRDAGW